MNRRELLDKPSASAEELREQLSLLYGPVEVLSYGGRFFMVEKADL